MHFPAIWELQNTKFSLRLQTYWGLQEILYQANNSPELNWELPKLFRWGHPSLYVTFSVCPSVRCTPYLRNRTLSKHNFWYTRVKWWYLQAFFSFFWNFDYLGCCGGKRAKYSPKWKIKITCVTCHISGTV